MIMLSSEAFALRLAWLQEEMHAILESPDDCWLIDVDPHQVLFVLDREQGIAVMMAPLGRLEKRVAKLDLSALRGAEQGHAYFSVSGSCLWSEAWCEEDLSPRSLAAHLGDVIELADDWVEASGEASSKLDISIP